MLKSFYVYEHTNKNIYDSARGYCILEQVNEDYFRCSIRDSEEKRRSGGSTMKRNIVIAMLILSIIGLGVSCGQNDGPEIKNSTVYESEAIGLSIEFPSEWEDKYVIEETEENITVFSKKVYEKYPGGGLLFTIERKIGELITQEDMQQEPVTQQIILQGNGYTYFTRLPSDVQYPLDEPELLSEYQTLSEQVHNVHQWVYLFGDHKPMAHNQGFKIVGSSFFTVEIPTDWALKAIEEPILSWSLYNQDNNEAGVIELIPYKSEKAGEKPTAVNIVREYLYNPDTSREIELLFNSELVDQETMEKIKGSLEFAGGPFNVVDLQSNALQYLSNGGKKVFGTIEDFVFSGDTPVSVSINVMQLLPDDSGQEYPNARNVEDLNKTETYSLDFGVSIALLAAPGYNTYGAYDIETINEDFINNQENYKDLYFDFILGSDGQLKIALERFVSK